MLCTIVLIALPVVHGNGPKEMKNLFEIAPHMDQKGVFGSTSLEELAYHMTFNLVFTNGEYSGSTLSVIGRNPFLNEYRELAIVGGYGVFRLARGIAQLNTVIFNSTTGDAIVEYNVMILHY
ncbi:hypothetical protein BUALT_Bualt19G0124700 [Buddleja alternifolia]|uniref:Dirigent protein n=1 Tax=Buddleja alternifolia TaxID=168488 RepID=A0AAV6W3F6_9LAMI|nr:hypothetical protein BUALT_Bualt19G0124700 [Buddleja alternifolia]